MTITIAATGYTRTGHENYIREKVGRRRARAKKYRNGEGRSFWCCERVVSELRWLAQVLKVGWSETDRECGCMAGCVSHTAEERRSRKVTSVVIITMVVLCVRNFVLVCMLLLV